MNRMNIPTSGSHPPLRRRVVQDEPAPVRSPWTTEVPLIGGGSAGRSIPTDTQATFPITAAETALVAVSVWMPDDLRHRIEATMPGVHRRSMVMVAYHKHSPTMHADLVHRPGTQPTGCKSRNWTVRLRRDEYGDIQALAQHLRWPISAVIRKLLELDVH